MKVTQDEAQKMQGSYVDYIDSEWEVVMGRKVHGTYLTPDGTLWLNVSLSASPQPDWVRYDQVMDVYDENGVKKEFGDDRMVLIAAVRNANGDVIIGCRHYGPKMQDAIRNRRDGESFVGRSGDDQGFIDNRGNYLTRAEALVLARQADQLISEPFVEGELHSENIY